MSGRVTDAMMYSKGQQAMARARSRMLENQEKAVTGLRVNKPSDDPVAAMRGIGLKVGDRRDEQVSVNMQLGHSMLSLADSSLAEMNDLLARAKELAIQMSNSTNANEDGRSAVANEIEQLQMRAVQIGNTRFGDRYIFGGYQSDKAPFDTNGTYYGDEGVMEIEVDRGQRMSVGLPGNLAFMGGLSSINQLKASAEPGTEESSLETNVTPGSDAEAKDMDIRGPAFERASVEHSGSVNIFKVLKDFSVGLRVGNTTAINQAIDDMDKSFQQVLESRTLVGARMNVLESGLSAIEGTRVNNAELLSQVQDADTLKVFSDLAKNENTLNASLKTNSKLLTPSLMDFLK